MNRWPTQCLGQLLSFEYGKALPQAQRDGVGTCVVAGSNGPQGFHSKSLVEGPVIVVGRKGSAGEVNWFEQDVWPIDTTYFVVPKISLNLRWLYYCLRNAGLERLVTATGVPGLNRNDAYRIAVSVPSIAEQGRIAELLDEADALRKLRVQADRRVADLVPAVFRDMFGDPASNPKKWPARRLRDLAEKYSDGPFGSNLKSSHYTPDGVRVIRLQNIGVGCLLDEDKAYISAQHFETLRNHECLPGDVIVGTLGNPNLRACILPPEIGRALNKADCVQIRADESRATATYVCWLLNLPSTLAMASGMIFGQTRARISMGRLAELMVPLPPISLQKEFAARVMEIDAIKERQAVSRHRLAELFNSLIDTAFNGGL